MSSPFGPMVVIVNSRAGRGKIKSSIPTMVEHLDRRGLEYEIKETTHRGHATEIARTALQEGIRFLVAVGGDGTIHEVVNGMIAEDRPVAEDAVLGVVAGGTGCDFIKTFGIPPMAAHAVAHLDGANAFPIDIGKITYQQDGDEVIRYFANIAEVGLGAEVVARAAGLPRWLGPTVYFFAFWLALGRHRSSAVRVDLVDRTYEGPMNNLVVANGQFFGGGMKIAPKAAPTDGLLDIQIEHARKRESIAIMPKVYKGQHVPHPDIEESKRVRLSIDSDRPLLIEADGEVLGTTPARFDLLRDAIRLKV
jgi:YegS/Rv2252/BmrU family lipid kinase